MSAKHPELDVLESVAASFSFGGALALCKPRLEIEGSVDLGRLSGEIRLYVFVPCRDTGQDIRVATRELVHPMMLNDRQRCADHIEALIARWWDHELHESLVRDGRRLREMH